MSTESLIIELDAKTAKLDSKLKKTEKHLDNLTDTTTKADSSLKKIGGAFASAGAIAVKTATAALALSAAIGAIALKAASSRRELEQFARQAKTSEENFQSLAFATKQFGIEGQKFADISKDISDRISEFMIAGTGVFQDYADTLRLTKEEARDVAVEFSTMSSEEVLGRMVSEMEKAGVSASDMTFALESMANDVTKLQPLFADNSKELKILKERFDTVNSSMQITNEQAEDLKNVATTFDLLSASFGKAATAVSATLAPALDQFFNDVIEVVPNATQAIINFLNSLKSAEDINSIKDITVQIMDNRKEVRLLVAEQERLSNMTVGAGQAADSHSIAVQSNAKQLKEAKGRASELTDQLIILQRQQDANTLADAERLEGGSISGTGGTGITTSTGTGDQLQSLKDSFKSEEDLLYEKLQRQLEIAGEDYLLREQLHERYLMNIVALDQADEDYRNANKSSQERDAKKAADKELKQEKKNVNDSIALAEFVFEDSKAISAGIALVNTAEGVTKAIAKGNYAGAALAGAIGAAQISTILSATKGGSGGASVSASPPSAQTEVTDNSSDFSLSDSSEAGSQTVNINFGTDSGDDLIDAIGSALNKAQREGRV